MTVGRFIVCGSRGWRSESAVRERVSQLPITAMLVHGGCRGADLIASSVWRALGGSSECHEARWNELGKRAGMVRNAEMAAAGADLCLAFRCPGASPGTDDMIRRAQRAGIPTEIIRGGAA